jgi:signal peptidase II
MALTTRIQITSRLVIIAALLGTIGCDRVTKHVATSMAGMPWKSYLADTVWLGYAENPGGFLSLGAGLPEGIRTLIFTGATGLMLVAVTVYALWRGVHGLAAIGLTLFVAGGASNWIDRALRGSVVDFLHVGIGSVRTGVFNVADVAILLGVALFVVGELNEERRAAPVAEPAGDSN